LEEHLHSEEPPQVVGEWHPEVATTLLPDPGIMDRRGCWIKAQIPGDHGEGSNKGNCERGEPTSLAATITNQHRAKHPGEVAGGKARSGPEPQTFSLDFSTPLGYSFLKLDCFK